MATGYQHGSAGGIGAPLGLEWAGVIEALGEGVVGYKVGDRVSGLGSGGFAEMATTHSSELFPLEDNMTFAEAVCYPVALRTMYEALMMSGEMKSGQRVLIQGASTAVGIVGMQVARILGAGMVNLGKGRAGLDHRSQRVDSCGCGRCVSRSGDGRPMRSI